VEPIDPTEKTVDGKPYSVLYYGNGPAYSEPRKLLNEEEMRKCKIYLSICAKLKELKELVY
jgi:hypothetical protein